MVLDLQTQGGLCNQLTLLLQLFLWGITFGNHLWSQEEDAKEKVKNMEMGKKDSSVLHWNAQPCSVDLQRLSDSKRVFDCLSYFSTL